MLFVITRDTDRALFRSHVMMAITQPTVVKLVVALQF